GNLRGAFLDDGLYVYHLLMMSTVVLLLMNTLGYMWEILSAGESERPNATRGRKVRRGAVFVMGFCSIVIFFWLVDIYVGFSANWLHDTDFEGLEHEILSIVLFFLFAVTDIMLAVSYDQTARNAAQGNAGFRKKRNGFIMQALLVDIPVVAGLVCVVAISAFWLHGVHHSFLHGFRSGALIGHLAPSQVIYVILIVLDKIWTD
ncbi:MAG: hypothetical protein AAGA30_00925, partial [Planctomycetota bacterium]